MADKYTQAPVPTPTPVRPANRDPNTVIRVRQSGFSLNAVRSRINSATPDVNVPSGLPRFFGNRQLLLFMWFLAMIIIGFDEWHNMGILPRPSRFWYSSVVYGGCAVLSMSDALVPIANALALGFTVMLLYQYYNSSGQFTGTPTKSTNPTPPSTGKTTTGVTTA